MTTSQPAPKMLALEALCGAVQTYSLIIRMDELARDGHEADALATLRLIAPVLASDLPVLKGVIAAERQTADALHLTQRTLAPFFPREPAEQPHPANDVSHVAPPHQPSDGVA